ncbi:MAG TPA: DUF748 domain-containing protein [Candidatus Sulfotelmatobacter sp.]|nr:DUF748 domain-containing protein [Candidatus Sulfotelmatobacter sp.]
MGTGRGKRWGLIALVVLVILIVGGIVGFRMAVGMLKGKVVEALGPDSEIKEIRVGWSSVDVEGLRIKGPKGWPAGDTLRAEHVAIVPALRSLLSGQIRVRSITIVRPYLSALRTRDGKLEVVPSLLEGTAGKGHAGASAAPAAAPPVTLGRIALQDGVVEFFDASVASPPLKIRLEQIQATVRDVVVPSLTGKSPFDLSGVLKGVRRDGRITVAGWAEIASKDSSVKTTLRSVDLVALQPYLIKAAETGVEKGALDLDLQSEVSKNRLKAPGKVTISDLELAPAKGGLGTFMGVPRDAVVAFLKNKENKITVHFVLEGDINNPQFSLNEALSTRLASSMAETLGVSLGGVVKGAGTLGQKGMEAATGATKGVGGALEGLFGGGKKR